MLFCTVRAKTVRLLGVLCVVLVLFFSVAVIADGTVADETEVGAVETVSYAKVKTDAERLAFLSSLGWETTGVVVSEETFTVPETFDRVMLGYNEIQKDIGLDLSRLKKKKVTRYTYEVTNYDGYEGKVYANIIVYRGKVVAADLSSADPMGFVRALTEKGTGKT